MTLPSPVAAFLAGAIVATVLAWVLLRRREEAIRAEALHQSRATLRGQLAEQVAPLLEAFPFDAADARFLGHPIDYVVFDGLSSDTSELELVFVEIKTGNARLSPREAAIRDAVREGRVRFEVIRL